MKKLYRKLSIVAIVLFILGIFMAAYNLYRFPELLIQAKVLDMLDMNQVKPIFGTLNLTIGSVLLFGLVSVILLLLADKSTTNENVIYVETFKTEAGNVQNEDTSNEAKTLSTEEKLQEIQQIINKEKDTKKCFDQVLSIVCKDLEASQGAIYLTIEKENRRFIELFSSFAFIIPESQTITFEFGEGLAGQAAKVGSLINLKSVPQGYIKIFSGLGKATPTNLVFAPFKIDNNVVGVAEIASFKEFSKADEKFMESAFMLLAAKAKASVKNENQKASASSVD